MALNKRDLLRIQSAINALEALTDEENGRCTLPPEAKRTVRPYVRSWVLPLLELVRDNEPTKQYE